MRIRGLDIDAQRTSNENKKKAKKATDNMRIQGLDAHGASNENKQNENKVLNTKTHKKREKKMKIPYPRKVFLIFFRNFRIFRIRKIRKIRKHIKNTLRG